VEEKAKDERKQGREQGRHTQGSRIKDEYKEKMNVW